MVVPQSPTPKLKNQGPHSLVNSQGKAVNHFCVHQTLQTLVCSQADRPGGRKCGGGCLIAILPLARPLIGKQWPNHAEVHSLWQHELRSHF